MGMNLADILNFGVSMYQGKRQSDIYEQHTKELKELQKKTFDQVNQLSYHVQAIGIQGLKPMQPAQPIAMQPMVAPAPLQAPSPTPAPQPDSAAVSQEIAKTEASPYSNYLSGYGHQSKDDVSIGCVPCARAHISTTSAALNRAANGDIDAVNDAREEMVALLEYDLTKDKLAATPERERVILEKYSAQIQQLYEDLSGPVPELTTASASIKEALRFAREDGIEHPEAQLRIARSEDLVNELERVTFAPERMAQLSPEEQERVKAALPQLRRTRQDLINNTRSADDLEAVSARLAQLDKALNPAPAPDRVAEVAGRAKALNTEFRKDVVAAWKGGGQ